MDHRHPVRQQACVVFLMIYDHGIHGYKKFLIKSVNIKKYLFFLRSFSLVVCAATAMMLLKMNCY